MFCRPRVFTFCTYPLKKIYRTFLSEQYKCTTEWQSRLSVPFMQKVDLDQLYYEIDQCFQQHGKASSIDLDIFVNKVSDAEDAHKDETTDMLHRFRMTEEASNILESTGHAVIRNFLETDNTSDLLHVLDDRLSYGVFLDQYIAIYALNKYIKKGDFHSAARIATFLMLQEDFDNEISQALSLYACYKYLEKAEPFYPPKEEEKGEPAEEVKVRVKFLRNEYFDDHFDLRNHLHLVGKTLAMVGRKMSSNIGKSAQILGFTLYQKYDKALEIAKSSDSALFKDVVLKCIDRIPEENDDDSVTQLRNHLVKISSSLNDSNYEKEIEKIIQVAVSKNEPTQIANQKNIYLEWNKTRENKLIEERERLLRTKRLKEIEKITENMKKEEEKLWFFENEDKIDLQIDSKVVFYPKRWFGKKKKPRVVDEGYIPPEIVKQRKSK